MVIQIAFFDVIILVLRRDQGLFQFLDKLLSEKGFFTIKKIAGVKGFLVYLLAQKIAVHFI